MDIATIVGLLLAIFSIVFALIMEGGHIGELFAVPSAIALIFGASLGATIVTVPLKTVLKLPQYLINVFTTKNFDFKANIELMTRLADKARREGLLALEEESKKIDDAFLKRGIMMVVDGVDPDQVESIMETNIKQMRTRHKQGAQFFTTAGGFAPTFGIIGTVMGLISVVQKLDDPSALGHSIGAAFLATLWGLLSANLVFLPMGGKLKSKSEEELRSRVMQLEGILAIQAGENPRVVRDKLECYLPPAEANAEEKAGRDSTAPVSASQGEEARA